MKKHIIVALVLISTAFSGCLVLSLYPIYTEDTLLNLESLEGTWMQDDSTSWTFKIDTTLMYQVIIDEFNYSTTESNTDSTVSRDTNFIYRTKHKFSAGLTQINGEIFMDMLPEQLNDSSYLYASHFIYSHSISKLKISGDSIMVMFLNYDWVEKSSKKIKKSIGYNKLDKNAVLTASTKDLRKFLSKFAKDTNAFPKADKYMIKVKK